MGWTSSGDPYAHVGESALNFDSEDAAKSFAERHGWEYAVKLIGIKLFFLRTWARLYVPVCQTAIYIPDVKLY